MPQIPSRYRISDIRRHRMTRLDKSGHVARHRQVVARLTWPTRTALRRMGRSGTALAASALACLAFATMADHSGHAGTLNSSAASSVWPAPVGGTGAANFDRAAGSEVSQSDDSVLPESYNYNPEGSGSDHDSVGLFQQRPSSGWGSVANLMDPNYAATAFYKALVRVQGWQSMALTWAAQAVQVSAYPYAYGPHESQAQAVVDALVPSS
jgi:hypothetical protein